MAVHNLFRHHWILAIPFWIIVLAVYLLPTIIAALRHAKSLAAIILVDILAGWTLVGWIVALVWSIAGASDKKST